MTKAIALSLIFVVLLCGCGDKANGEYAHEILENRKIYRKEIQELYLECLSLSNKNLSVHYNDSDEVVSECLRSSRTMYGAYSEYNDKYLHKQAIKYRNMKGGE